MLSIFNKLIKENLLLAFLVCFILLVSSKAFADTAFIYYSTGGTNTSSQYANLKSELEDLGYTVSGSTSGTVSSTDISGKDLVIDIAGTSNCGSTCKTNYESYLSSGGKLLIAGTNGATNRNDNIEQLIESKLSVGTFTQAGGCNACYYSVRKGDYASSTTSENTLPGSDKYMYNVTNGTTVAANSSSNNNIPIMHKWDYGSNGGSVYVTFGYGQFLSTHTYANNMDALLLRIMEEEGLYSSTVNITPTTTQSSTITTDKARTGNGVKMNVDGDGNTVNIEQTGEDNFIIGTDWSSDSAITGNNNTVNIDQGNVTTSGSSGNNGIALDITGNTNTLNISQGDYGTDTGDHRIWLDIDGSTNTLTLQQRNDGTTSSEHYMNLDLDSSSNVITMQQLDNGDKTLFLDINNNNNAVDINQSGSGEHFLDLTLGSGSYAHDVDISQTGSGDHAARVDLDGYSTDFDLSQTGSTDQDYNVDMTCGVQAGCTLSTTQGN